MAESREPRVFRLKCAKCGGIVVCPETIVETGGACADCGQAIVIAAYPPLRKLAEERAAARAAEKQRRDEERRAQREAEERQRARQREEARQRSEEEERQKEEQKRRWLADVRRKDQERTAQQDQEAREAGLSQATAAVRAVPMYTGLKAASWTFAWLGWVVIGLSALVACLAVVAMFTKLMSLVVGFVVFGSAIVGEIAAEVLFALSHGLAAIRDMTINSWKQVILLQEMEKRAGRRGATGAEAERSPAE